MDIEIINPKDNFIKDEVTKAVIMDLLLLQLLRL